MQAYRLYLNEKPHAKGTLSYITQVIKDYLDHNEMYEYESVEFKVEKI